MPDQSPMPDSSQLMAALDASQQPQQPPQGYPQGFPTGGMNTVVNAAAPSGQPSQQQDPNMIMNALQRNSGTEKALASQEMGEMAPQHAALQKLQGQPMPQKPDLKAEFMKSPGVQEYMKMVQSLKSSGQEFMTTAGLLSGLVGAFSRKHTTLALKAYAAAVDGVKKGQGDAVKQQLEIFQDANKQAVENAKMLQDEYNNAMNERNASAQEILANMKAISEKYHDPLMAQKIDDGDFFKMQSLLLQRDKAAMSVSALNEKIGSEVVQVQDAQVGVALDHMRSFGGDAIEVADGAEQVLKNKEALPTPGSRNPIQQGIYDLVNRISKSTGKPYDAAAFKAYQSSLIKLADSSVPTHIGDIEQSISKVNNHLDTLQNAMTALNSGDSRTINAAAQKLATEFNDPTIVSAQTAAIAVANEFNKVFVPTGGVEDERKAQISNISPASGPDQIKAAIATMKELMTGQAKGISLIGQTIRSGGDVTKLNVPASYVVEVTKNSSSDGDSSSIPNNFIDYLKAHPESASSFDKKFGAGASQKYLGQ